MPIGPAVELVPAGVILAEQLGEGGIAADEVGDVLGMAPAAPIIHLALEAPGRDVLRVGEDRQVELLLSPAGQIATRTRGPGPGAGGGDRPRAWRASS